MKQIIRAIYLDNDSLYILDQRYLPQEETVVELKNEGEVYDAIKTLAVRGAPAIGIAAAYGVYISLKHSANLSISQFRERAQEVIQYIGESRPTAYNLFYALGRMKAVLLKCDSVKDCLDALKQEALSLHHEDIEKSALIGKNGQPVIPDGARILSHCNAGGLATGGGGTSLAVVFEAHAAGKNVFVYVDETRPLLQGSRLTAWELSKVGIPYQVITDNMAGMLMKQGKIDLVILGADRIARNGDFANKIGTYSVAVLAKHHGIPFYTAAPFTTFDLNIQSGKQIPIEERDKREVLSFNGTWSAPQGADAYNPSFDVTPHELLTGIVTEFGMIYPPFDENIEKLLLNRE